MTDPWWVIHLEEATKDSLCRSDLLRKFNLSTNGSGNHRIVQRWIDKLNVDTTHFNPNKVRGINSGKKTAANLDDILQQNTNITKSVRKKLRTILEYKCMCGNDGVHNGLPLTLQLDHINGIHTDNRIENLRWLCPNCHTQTPTYGNKRSKIIKLSTTNPDWRKLDRPDKRKVVRPTKGELELLIEKHSMVKIGKMFGVSDNAVRKWKKRYGL